MCCLLPDLKAYEARISLDKIIIIIIVPLQIYWPSKMLMIK